MSKTHFDPTVSGPTLVSEIPLHKTAYSGGVNGIVSSNHVSDVDCRVCARRMLSPREQSRFTFEELVSIRSILA